MRISATVAAFGVLAMLSGCGDSTPAPDEPELTQEITEPDPETGIMLSDASVRLPAVDGRPGVAYFTVQAPDDAGLEIVSVFVDNVGRAELHRTVEEGGVNRMETVESVMVPAGESVSFEPGGYHVMLFDVGPAMVASGMAEMTVSFANGDKASVAAPVSAAGDEMEGMN